MKKFLFVYALLATAAAWVGIRLCADTKSEVRRLERNAEVLSDSVVHYRTALGREAASVGALELRCEEYARRHGDDARTIRDLGIRLKRLETTSKTALSTSVEVTAAVAASDSAECGRRQGDTVRRFGWSDGWVSVEGSIGGDSVVCSVTSRDTLHTIVHRVPRRFLFIRYGTKAVRQEVVSSNPHTQIVCTEYIEFAPRRTGRRGRR